MKKLFVCIVCFGLSALAAGAAGEKDKKATEKSAFEGAWIAVAGNADGKKIPDDVIGKISLTATFTDGKYNVMVMGKQIEAGTYKSDAKAKPATIDMTIDEGKDKGKTQLGIYKLEGDQLVIALGSAGSKERPKNFEGGDMIEVTTLKRKK